MAPVSNGIKCNSLSHFSLSILALLPLCIFSIAIIVSHSSTSHPSDLSLIQNTSRTGFRTSLEDTTKEVTVHVHSRNTAQSLRAASELALVAQTSYQETSASPFSFSKTKKDWLGFGKGKLFCQLARNPRPTIGAVLFPFCLYFLGYWHRKEMLALTTQPTPATIIQWVVYNCAQELLLTRKAGNDHLYLTVKFHLVYCRRLCMPVHQTQEVHFSL